ncbi:hypothetical protein U1Q18_024295 [Sarracenia purpurea var. burkii]
MESSIREEFSPALMVDSSPSLNLSLSRGGKFSSSARFLLRRHQFHLPEVTGELKNLQFFAILMSPSSSSPLPESFSNTPAQGIYDLYFSYL